MLRGIRDVIYIALAVLVLYAVVKVKIYHTRYWPEIIRVTNIQLTAVDSIIYQSDSLLIPINYKGSIDLRDVNPDKRKDLFIMHILPAIVITRERLMDDLHHVDFIEDRINQKKSLSRSDSLFLVSIKQRYETDSLSELKKRIYPHPVSLVLTQAILESGWGTSSIFRNGNNIFGIMSFSSDDPRSQMPFIEGDDDRYLRTYNSIAESVDHYFLFIGTVSSYKKFRQKRWEGGASTQLVRYLGRYHDHSEQYAEMAQSIIVSNNLERYDNISINPKYIGTETLESFLMKY